MFLKRSLLGLGLALTLLAPADAAITRVNLGYHQSSGGGTTNVITTGADCPVGSVIVVVSSLNFASDSLSSVADNATGGSNTYTTFDNIAGTGTEIGWGYTSVVTTNDLPIGGHITLTFGSTLTNSTATAECVSGITASPALDVHNNTSQGTAASSATTVNSGTLSKSSEILYGGVSFSGGTGSQTCGGSFSTAQTSTSYVMMCYQVVSSTASVGFTPSWVGGSFNYVSDLVSFQATGGSASVIPSLTLLGAGP